MWQGAILDSTADRVLAVGHDWIVTYANGKALKAFENLKVGTPYWSCFPALEGTPEERQQREAMQRRLEVHSECTYLTDGECYRVSLYPIEAGLSIFFSDITEEKTLQDKVALEQLLREKRIEALSHMAGGLAHEISNPLAIIKGWAHDLKSMASEKAVLSSLEIDAMCDKILKTTNRASNILRGLKAFARDAAHDPMEPASIHTILDQAMEFQESRFVRQQVEIRMDLQEEIPLFPCREVQIGQILTNLLNNAFDAIVQSDAEERWVAVSARFSESELVVEVSDSGPGIQEHQKSHLMQPFFTTKELGFGMGVGLSLSRAIAQGHGGNLTLVQDSQRTCFRLVLPMNHVAAEHDGPLMY